MPRPQAKRVTTRVLLRLPADVHRALTGEAVDAGLSFNELCVRRLSAQAHPHDVTTARSAIVGRAGRTFGCHLLGVVAVGSWVRGEAATGSDIDVLIVLDAGTPLSRDLYRRWDTQAATVEGRDVDAHFIHPPVSDAPPSAPWCEAAVDGVVWFDKDGGIVAHLGRIRRAIAEHRVVRKLVHGQPYWKGAA